MLKKLMMVFRMITNVNNVTNLFHWHLSSRGILKMSTLLIGLIISKTIEKNKCRGRTWNILFKMNISLFYEFPVELN